MSTCDLIDQTQIADFNLDGAACVRRVFDQEDVDRLAGFVEAWMANPGRHCRDFGQGGGSFFSDIFGWRRDDAYGAWLVQSPLGEIASAFLQVPEVRLYFDHLLVKEPAGAAKTPWHQDAPYWPMSGRQCLSGWIALDPVDLTSGAVEYICGTHATGAIYAPKAFSGDNGLNNAKLTPLPDIDNNRDDFDIVSWELAPGDVVFHHCLTLHGAPANQRSDRRRRGLAVRFIGPDIRFDLFDGIAEPMRRYFDDLAPHLRRGDALDGPVFPIAWQQN